MLHDWVQRYSLGKKTTLLKPQQQEKYNDVAAQFAEPLYYLLKQDDTYIDPIC